MECTGGRAGDVLRMCRECARDAPGMLWGRAEGCTGYALGMRWGCTGDADPAAQLRAGALPSSAGLPVTSNDFLCSCFRAGAAWPAGGLVAVSRAAGELPLCVT